MKPTDLPNLIIDGRLDSVLDEMVAAINQRRLTLRDRKAAENKRAMVPGTKVRITAGLKPRYLVGLEGVVVEPDSLPPQLKTRQEKKRVNRHLPVKLSAGRDQLGRYADTVMIPASCLEKV